MPLIRTDGVPARRALLRAGGFLWRALGHAGFALLVVLNILALHLGPTFGLAQGHARTAGACLLVVGATVLLCGRALAVAVAIPSLLYMFLCRLLKKVIVYAGGLCLLAAALIGCLEDDMGILAFSVLGVVVMALLWWFVDVAELFLKLFAGWHDDPWPTVPRRVDPTIPTGEQAQAEADRMLLEEYREWEVPR